MEAYAAIIGAFAVPAIVFLGNLWVRVAFSNALPTSAGADWALLLFVFDFAASQEKGTFFSIIPNEWVHLHAEGVFGWLLAATAATWFALVARIEPHLAGRRRSQGLLSKTVALLVAIGLVVFLTGSHICIYVCKGN